MAKILIACEESQTICKAFRAKGYECYSCDIQKPSGGHPEWHIWGDAIKAITGGVIMTMDGMLHYIGQWDLVIAHPPCTYLSNVATRAFSLRCSNPDKVVTRWQLRAEAAVFFMQFTASNAKRIAIENPIGFMNTSYRKPDQIISPYMFASSVNDADNYVTKATCLWLYNLPNLITNDLPKPNNALMFGVTPSGKARTWEDTVSRSGKIRSKTFPGIANAIVDQWGKLL